MAETRVINKYPVEQLLWSSPANFMARQIVVGRPEERKPGRSTPSLAQKSLVTGADVLHDPLPGWRSGNISLTNGLVVRGSSLR
jgi:hypothetical protein